MFGYLTGARPNVDVEAKEVREGVPDFLKMQECYNICIAAYKEIMTLALKEKSWVVDVPVLGAIEEFQRMFREPPSPGMAIEYSVGSGIVPLSVENVLASMTDVDEWASVFCNIVHNRTIEVPSGVLNLFSSNMQPHKRDYFKCVREINAELFLPMPCAPTRRFSFIRFVREVIADVYAVVDLSTDYFPDSNTTLNANCKRRPSAVIVRRRDDHSELIWIENMEVPKCNVEDSIYSDVNLNLAFDANRWISMLSSKEKRIRSKFSSSRMPVMNNAFWVRDRLLASASRLKMEYLSFLALPDETKWDILSDSEIKIWKDTYAQGKDNYIVLTTSRVKATPPSVFNFLVKRTPQFQWPCLAEMAEPEVVINLVADDDSSCITVHAKRMMQTDSREQAMQTESTKNYECVLQETARDEFCSFIISSPIDLSEFDSALGVRKESYFFGFSIIPDGSLGLLSDGSIVTMACQQELDADLETDEVIERMSDLANGVIEAINGSFTKGEEAVEL